MMGLSDREIFRERLCGCLFCFVRPAPSECAPSQVIEYLSHCLVHLFVRNRKGVEMADFAQAKEDVLREFLDREGDHPATTPSGCSIRWALPLAFRGFVAKFDFRADHNNGDFAEGP
jgi:hypothetical protein